MTNEQFDALAKLARLRAGPAREACRLVMVDGASVPDAARATGMVYRVAHQAVTRARAAHALAVTASSDRRDVFGWYDPTADTLHKTVHDDDVVRGAQLWPLYR